MPSNEHIKININSKNAKHESRNTTSLFMNLNPNKKARSSLLRNLYNKSSLDNLLDIFLEKLIDFPDYVKRVKKEKLKDLSIKRNDNRVRISITPIQTKKMNINELKKEIKKSKYSNQLKKLNNKLQNKKKKQNINRLVKIFEAGMIMNKNPKKCNYMLGKSPRIS
jgi:hypothetical protein